jgi:AAA domain, putative AbiEii toxin, Type IV TA system/AAA ATPase domain
MRINKIEIRNFRAFEAKNAAFDPLFTLLVGPNGSGKSSLLSAVARATRGVLKLGLDAKPGQPKSGTPFAESDYRRSTRVDAGGAAWSQVQAPTLLKVDWHDNEQHAQVESLEAEPGRWGGATSFRIDQIKSWMSEQTATPVPMVFHVGVDPIEPHDRQLISTASPFASREQVYESSWERAFDPRRLVQWFQHNELRTLQEGQSPAAYSAARQAALSGIHASDIRFVVKDNQLMLLHEGEGWRPFDQLSDGQKRIAGIFCELALRCASLNSHLGDRCIVDTPGIVTIDELDLHLHPKWQRSLIGDLCRTFPKLQFIAASHSPFLLQAAFEYGQVLNVSTGQFVEPGDTSIEDIAEAVMGVPQPQRSQRFNDLKAKAQRYYELLEGQPVSDADRQSLQDELDRAMAPFANDPATAAWLAQRREAAGH